MQNETALCVKALGRMLYRTVHGDGKGDDRSFSVSELVSLFGHFYHVTWAKELADGTSAAAALTTAACMPLWEMLSTFTTDCAIGDARRKAFVVQLLTAMYPKARDRRCLFQQLDPLGINTTSAVPLYVRAPDATLATLLRACNGSVSEPYRSAVRFSITGCDSRLTESKVAAHVSAHLDSLMKKVLPLCVIVHATAGRDGARKDQVAICLDDTSLRASSWRVFALMLWKSIVMAEMHCPSEAKTFMTFLTTSSWARQAVQANGRVTLYGDILTTLIDACMVCMSVSPRVVSTAAANTALIDPAVTRNLAVQKNLVDCTDADATHTLSQPYCTHAVSDQKGVVAVDSGEKVGNILKQTVPGEIMFSGASSSCRDCDQLTLITRDILFAPLAVGNSSKGMNVHMLRACMLNRKRGREGPSLLPVQTSLAEAISSDTSAVKQSTLERLCQTVFVHDTGV